MPSCPADEVDSMIQIRHEVLTWSCWVCASNCSKSCVCFVSYENTLQPGININIISVDLAEEVKKQSTMSLSKRI